MSDYSAIIELVGLKEYAEDDPAYFMEMTVRFKQELAETLQQRYDAAKNAKDKYAVNPPFNIYYFRDYCYVSCENIQELIRFLEDVRLSFFSQTQLLFRSVISNDKVDLHKDDPDIVGNHVITSYGFDKNTSKLYGILERYKGIGIFVDESLHKELADRTFTNYYVSDIGSTMYQPYQDIRLSQDDALLTRVDRIVRVFDTSRLISKKIARFYIPLLLNIAKNTDYKAERTSVGLHHLELFSDIMISCKDVSGIELVHLTFINNLFGNEDLKRSKRRYEFMGKVRNKENKTNQAEVNWLLGILRIDNKGGVPNEIITDKVRRIALREIAHSDPTELPL